MKIQLKFDDQIKTADLNYITFEKPQRIKNGLKTFGLFFLASCLSVLIPVLHFFLVPSLLIAAFVMGLRSYNQLSDIELPDLKCPKCNTIFKEKKVYILKDEEYGKLFCYGCQTRIYLGLESK